MNSVECQYVPPLVMSLAVITSVAAIGLYIERGTWLFVPPAIFIFAMAVYVAWECV